MRRLAFLALLPALASCAWYDSVTGHDTLAVLRQNRVRWVQSGLTTYRLHYTTSSSWSLPKTITIEVVNGVVTGVLDGSPGGPVPPTPGISVPTVDSLFVWAEQRIRSGYTVKVVYDAAFHFPGQVSGDIPGALDAAFGQTASLDLEFLTS